MYRNTQPKHLQRIDRITAPLYEWCQMVIEDDSYIILDTETTDKNGEICELGIISATGRELYNSLIKPSCAMNPEAQRIHRISEEQLSSAPTFADAWPTIRGVLYDNLNKCNKKIITYNASFDMSRFVQTAKARGVQLPPLQWYCLMIAYAEHWNAPHRSGFANAPWQKLQEACKQQSVGLTHQTHRATDDCRATLALMRRIAEMGKKSPTFATSIYSID
jgi:DNA polymerase III subunit epsilon